MAKLFSLPGAVAHDDPEYGHFAPGKDGGFAFPDDLSDRLLRFHVRGRPLWEDEIQRQHRVAAEDLARQRDPAYLAGLVAQLVAARPQPAAGQDVESLVAKAVAAALAEREAAEKTETPAKAPAPRKGTAKTGA